MAQVSTGAAVSTTVTVWLHCAELPQASVACQVRVALKVLPQAALVTVLRIRTVFVPPRSDAAGGSKVQTLPHSTVLSATQVSVGAVVSETVMVWLHCEVFPQ